MDWANEIVHELHYKKNYNIIIVSSGYSPNICAKQIWINNNLPFCEFIGVNMKEYKDKSHVDMSDGLFIDDSAKNLETSNAKYKICFGDEYPWNKDWNGIRCVNWHDVKNEIKKIEEGGDSYELYYNNSSVSKRIIK